jgi:hypothetical protein
MKLILHSRVQFHTMYPNDNINTDTSEKLTHDIVSNAWRMKVRHTVTSRMTVLQRTRQIGRSWFYKNGLINNRSVASASSRSKPVIFLLAVTH